MWEPNPSFSELRQGDIVEVVAYPQWAVNKSHAMVDSGGSTSAIIIPTMTKLLRQEQPLVALCSHDCDMENPRGRTGILVAPVIPVPSSPGERHDEIMNSGDMSVDTISFGHLFPVEIARPEGIQKGVIDFSAMTSMGPAQIVTSQLQSAKLYQMTDATRQNFRMKLAYFVGRP